MRFMAWMMRAGATLLAAGALAFAAAPVITDVVIENVSHSSVTLRFTTSETGPGTAVRMEYGLTPALGLQTYTMTGGSGATTRRGVNAGGLAPATRYYFRPVASDNAGAFNTGWSCPSAGAFSGYTCEEAGALPYFTTAALPERHPAAPAPPATLDTRMPAIDGSTFTVSVDGNSRCTDFAAQLQACAAADGALNHEVVIPAGASCAGNFVLPRKTGAGTCVVRTSTPYELLPPEGVRIDPSYLPLMASIVIPASRLGQNLGNDAIGTPSCATPPCTEGWRFTGIHFTVEPHGSLEPTLLNIANISGNTLTLDGPHGLPGYAQVYIAGVEGVTGANGVRRITPVSANQLSLQETTISGTYVPNTGYLLRTVSIPVADASNTNPVILTTAGRHGLNNEAELPVLSISGATLTVAAGHNIGGLRAVEIRGSTAAEYNGIWTTASSGATTITLAKAPAGSCAAECGTIRLKPSLQVFGAGGNTAANGSKLFTVLSATTIQLDQTAGNGDYTSGGHITFDPDMYFSMIGFQTGSARMVLDRCYVHGLGFPHRYYLGIALESDRSAVVDSYIEGINSWRPINPQSGMYEAGYAGTNFGGSIAIDFTNGSVKKISNNYIGEVAGITLFAQGPSEPLPTDIEITRNTIVRSDALRAGSSASDGLWHGNRHLIEFKSGRRLSIDGNVLDGNWADAVPLGPAVLLSARGGIPGSGISDVQISNNVFRNVASAIQIEGSDNVKETPTSATARVHVVNNLFHDVDFYRMRSAPSPIGGAGPSENFGGFAVMMDWSNEDTVIAHNTIFDNRGKAPLFFWYAYGQSEGAVVKNNIFTHNYDNEAGGISKFNTTALPITGDQKQTFDRYFTWAPNADPTSSFSHNVVLPGVRKSSSSASYDDRSGALNFTAAECTNFYRGFASIYCVGSGSPGETANERFARTGFVGAAQRDFRLRDDSPFKSGGVAPASDGRDMGVDMDALEAAAGRVKDVRVINLTATGAALTYRTPDGAACHVDYTTDATFGSITRVGDGGDAKVRTVQLNDLTPATLYYYRVQCASEQPKGSFVTAAM